jgi:hypothetical protein
LNLSTIGLSFGVLGREKAWTMLKVSQAFLNSPSNSDPLSEWTKETCPSTRYIILLRKSRVFLEELVG